MFEIIRYTPDKADEWNQFIAKSKNGTFLCDRNYMDYHSDRFQDYSLLFYREGKLFGLLPANIQEDTLHSHQGLTYGGLIMNEKTIAEHVQQLFRELNEWLKIKGIKKVVYKPVPHIFHSIPAEEDLFSLYSICNAQIIDRSLSTAIDLIRPLAWHRDRKYGINRSAKNGVTIEESNNWSSFWQILSENLMEKYGAHPVHTLQEIELLHSRFPQQIKLFTACRENEVLGGTVIYLTPIVGLLFMAVCFLFLDPILLFFGASNVTLPYAREFMEVILAGNIITHMYFGMNAVLRAAGKPRQAMYAVLFTVGMNIALIIAFVWWFRWGIRGAALATVTSQSMALCWQLWIFSNKKELLHLKRGIYRLKADLVKNIISIGVSPFLMNATACVVVIFM